MKEPLSTCSYNLLYRDLKRFSKNGEYFCKELVTVFQQRSELEISYAKRLQKLAGKLLSVSKTMTSNSTYNAWSLVSNEMFSTAEAHRTLGQSLQQDAGVEIRQMVDEHTKRKRPLENAIEKSRKLVVNNWNEQLKAKKKLTGLTREHEALFSFVEKNKHICTEKEKQKMLNRLSKSAELQVRVDEEYFKMNLDSHQIRLKWENTLKSCYQIVQETEKQRLETLSKAVNKYNLLMSSYSQSLLHSEQQIEDAVRRVDVEKDIQTLVENTCVTADDKAEFLIVDYFEEEGKTVMDKERRRDALKMKLQRLQECILKTRKEKEGLEKIVGVDHENISQMSEKTPEEHEQLLEEYILKLDILEATYCKLNQSLMDLEGKPKPSHRFNDSITKFTEKEVAHSIARLPRPIRIKRPPFRSRQSFRTSLIFKTSAKNSVNHQDSIPCVEASAESADHAHRHMTDPNGASSRSRNKTREGAESSSVGKCKALYDFSSEKRDELNIKEGDLLDILRKDSSGWWYGELNGKKGHFPYNYVKELPVLKMAKTSDA